MSRRTAADQAAADRDLLPPAGMAQEPLCQQQLLPGSGGGRLPHLASDAGCREPLPTGQVPG
ncbi:MAG: hypothetical protein IKP48_08190 [Bacteroidaceae bacterium]|nr:hypothetical protein [Bacteroidaceae bacterium]